MARPITVRRLEGISTPSHTTALILRYLRRSAINQEEIMQAIDDLVAKVDEVKTDVQRLLDALETERLSPETMAKVTALQSTLDGLDEAMDAAVPEPTEPEPEPEPGTEGETR